MRHENDENMKNYENDDNDEDALALEFVDYTGKQGLSDHTLGSTANNTLLSRSALTLLQCGDDNFLIKWKQYPVIRLNY